MKQLEYNQLIGFKFNSPQLVTNNCAHVFGGRNRDDAGNFSFSGGRDILAAQRVRANWCDYLSANPAHLVVGGQTHTANVQVVDYSHQSRGALTPSSVIADCDGLLTTCPNLPLYIGVADCSAVLLSSPTAVAVVHAGWRGLESQIIDVAISKMVEQGSTLDEIWGGVAPCIRAQSYEVGPEVARQCPDSAKYRGRADRWQVDIALWAQQQLLDCGLLPENVELSKIDSYSDQRLFSHRRQGAAAGRNGLLAMLVDDSD
ncbi:MAG: polyphenol oxidase family protein [Planctomycetes bacterium]|nr:polyphenol oxidase family protein [Planctomycetota bacterium]